MSTRSRFTLLLFAISLGMILFFSLESLRVSKRLHQLPRPIGNWLNTHDNFANYFTFTIFSFLGFTLPAIPHKGCRLTGFAAALSSSRVRLGMFLALVSGLELAQIGIPGRMCDWHDIVTGSSGVLTAWLVIRWKIRINYATGRRTSRSVQILGIQFFSGSAGEAVKRATKGGLIVFPSAPVLVALVEDEATRKALLEADLALMDSGLMVLVWKILKRDAVVRVSGLKYLKVLLGELQNQRVLWVMPNQQSMERSIGWLRKQGHLTTQEECYIAPLYMSGRIRDPELLEFIRSRQPQHVIMAIGGGVQEKLGHYLVKNLPGLPKPSIHCTGAAIGFLSGDQTHIPNWADHFGLGWLLRCLHEPSRYVPRYWKARKLVGLLFKYRERRPDWPGADILEG